MRKRPMLMVQWEDISSLRHWQDESDDFTNETIHCVSVGWRMKSNRRNLVIASTRSENKQITDVNVIPRGCIKSIRRIE